MKRWQILLLALLVLAAILACGGPGMVSNERLRQTPTPDAQQEAREAQEAHATGWKAPQVVVPTVP